MSTFISLINTIILSLLPISELRGGIPYGVASGLSFQLVFIVSVLANIAVIPLVFLFLDKINSLLLGIQWYNRFFYKNLARAQHKIHKSVEKYGYLGLMIFVAIPLPVTGAYTGALGAWALGMDKKKAFYYISLGVIIAGVIVSLAVYLGIKALSIFIN